MATASWIESANAPTSDFSIANLPLGTGGENGRDLYTRIGDEVVNVSALAAHDLLPGPILSSAQAKDVLTSGSPGGRPALNALAAMGPSAWSELRSTLQRLLGSDEGTLRDSPRLRDPKLGVVLPVGDVAMRVPLACGNFTDFYASRGHATNVGKMFGRDPPLMPNWGNLPVAYHSRASSVIVSGTAVRRPKGLVLPKGASAPVYKPTSVLDYELEMGLFIGPGTDLGTPVSCDAARGHILGLVLVNDWSARDVQKYEYVPLGPFNAKNFATSVSPWVVTLDALEPFKEVAAAQDIAQVAPYLSHGGGVQRTTFAIDLEATIAPEAHPNVETVVTRSNFRNLYWTIDQMVAHQTATGCNLCTGDLLATGTISGEAEESRACLLEKSWAGSVAFALDSGEERTYLSDGDRVTLRAKAGGPTSGVGFGACVGKVLPALAG